MDGHRSVSASKNYSNLFRFVYDGATPNLPSATITNGAAGSPMATKNPHCITARLRSSAGSNPEPGPSMSAARAARTAIPAMALLPFGFYVAVEGAIESARAAKERRGVSVNIIARVARGGTPLWRKVRASKRMR